MNKAYSRINWQNDPNHTTPLNATNLNAMDSALDTIDDRVVALDSGKSSVTMTPALQSGTKVADYSINGVGGSLYAPTGGGANALTDLTDTAISSPSNGQVLKYNTSTSKWENANESGGGGGSSSLSGLSDVSLDTLADGESLVYDSATSKWKDKQLTATDVGAMSSSAALNDISDVTLSSPSNGQVLGYDSTTNKWKNMDAPSSGGGHTIKNESGTALTQRDNLQFKGCSVSDDSTNNATVVSVQTSNRNLLDNAWFTVNQKGLTSGDFNNNRIDRWKTSYASSPNGNWNLTNGILTLNNTVTGNEYWTQVIENASELVGKQVTVSILFSNGNIGTNTFQFGAESYQTTYYDDNCSIIISLRISSSSSLMLTIKGGKSISIKALKLELGSASTLAFDTAPDYATELLKCQRYLYPLGGKSFNAMVSALQQTRQWLTITLPTEMRAVPTFSGSLTTEGISGSTRVENTVTSSNITVTKTQDIEFNFTTSSNYNLCSCARVNFASGSYLSAEL